MTINNPDDCVVLHVVGPDRPGITSTLTGIIAHEGATLVDIGQSVLHDYLSLSAIVEIPPGSDALRKVLIAVGRMGLRLEVGTWNPARHEAPPVSDTLAVTLLGDLRNGQAVSDTTGFLADRGMNIRDLKTLSHEGLQGLELQVDLPPGGLLPDEELARVRGEILLLGRTLNVDMAVQRDGVFRRNKRLVCMDVDSTFIQMEVIDELAKLSGCGEQVAQVTERAMRGELDFPASLRERVACLKGLPIARARELLDNVPMTPGAEELVRNLRALGLRIGLVSGGFSFFVDTLKQRFGLDFAFANQLEVRDGLLTGSVFGSIVDAERKAQLLRDMAHVYQCRLEQCVAVGDGANDIQMLQTAGLGIAFRAKPRLKEIADLSLDRMPLSAILYLMGFHERDLKTLGSAG
jgi:phosphoserine phosphatase